ncbi:Mevalonate kinase [Smittium culicis]|uniref:mevalonate kinase n=1 Tax=Smittium culicis TaxID=133412 RepID=A0A1R1YFN6_9FUNG|nr:Mevalonate kinase [Smittium culicis]
MNPITQSLFNDISYAYIILNTLACSRCNCPEELNTPGDIKDFADKLHKEEKIEIPEDSRKISALYVALYLYSSLVPKEKRNKGLSISIRSSIPIGSGLGSSASYSSSLASLIGIYSGSLLDSSSKLDMSLVNEMAFKAEQVVHGMPSGVDNTTVINGGFVRYSKGKPLEILPNDNSTNNEKNSLMFIIVDTKVPKNTKVTNEGNAKELISEIGNISTILFDMLSDAPKDTNDHYFKSRNSTISELIKQNHDALAKLGVSHEKLEHIIDVSKKHGYSAKMTGGGGGGCAIVFIHNHADTFNNTHNPSLNSNLPSANNLSSDSIISNDNSISESNILNEERSKTERIIKNNSSSENLVEELTRNGYTCYPAILGCNGLSVKYQIDDPGFEDWFMNCSIQKLAEI